MKGFIVGLVIGYNVRKVKESYDYFEENPEPDDPRRIAVNETIDNVKNVVINVTNHIKDRWASAEYKQRFNDIIKQNELS